MMRDPMEIRGSSRDLAPGQEASGCSTCLHTRTNCGPASVQTSTSRNEERAANTHTRVAVCSHVQASRNMGFCGIRVPSAKVCDQFDTHRGAGGHDAREVLGKDALHHVEVLGDVVDIHRPVPAFQKLRHHVAATAPAAFATCRARTHASTHTTHGSTHTRNTRQLRTRKYLIMSSRRLEISDLPPPDTVAGLCKLAPSAKMPLRCHVSYLYVPAQRICHVPLCVCPLGELT